MQIETLYYLLAIEKYGSTRKAAETLNTSYQNVSRVLLQLEEEWGVHLFQRGSKGMQPTEEGKLAIATAREMLRLYHSMQEQFQYRAEVLYAERNERFSGSLEICSSMVANNGFVNDLLVEFSAQYPRIQVKILEEDAYRSDSEGQSRLSFVPRVPKDLEEQNCKVVPLLHDKIVTLVRKDSAFSKQKSISLAKLVKLPLVLVAKNHWEESIFGRILKVNKAIPEKPIFTSSVIGFQKYVATGQYIGLSTEIISFKLMSDKKRMFEIIPIRDKNVAFYHCLVIKDEAQLTRNEQCFINFVKESFHITE